MRCVMGDTHHLFISKREREERGEMQKETERDRETEQRGGGVSLFFLG